MKWRRSNLLNLPSGIGTLLLAIWLIATGALPLLDIGGRGLDTILHLLAVVPGVFLLPGRK